MGMNLRIGTKKASKEEIWKTVKLCVDSARKSGLKFVQYFSEMV